MGETRRAHMMTLRLSLFIALIGVCHGLKNMADEVVPEKQQKQTTFYENDETGDCLLEVEGGCTNTPRWHDADGATYDCDWYSQGSNCATYGSSYAGVAGETANQACCVCQTASSSTGATPQPTEGAWTPPAWMINEIAADNAAASTAAQAEAAAAQADAAFYAA